MSVTPNLRLWSIISNASSIIYEFAKADTKKKEVPTFYKFEQTVLRTQEDKSDYYRALEEHFGILSNSKDVLYQDFLDGQVSKNEK